MSDAPLPSPPPASREARIRAGSAQRRAARREDTRRAILAAATELFQAQGYEDFSLRQVAEAIGYSPTTIYLYFADKDDLLFHAAMEGFALFGERLQAAYESSSDPAAKLAALGRAYIAFGLEHPVNYRLMFMQRGEFLDRTPPEGCESVIDSFGLLLRAVQEGLAAGRIRPGDERAYAGMIWAGVHGIVSLAIATPYFDREAAFGLQALFETTLREGILR